jgi:hypothetical protein
MSWGVQESAGEKRKAGDDEAKEADAKKAKTEVEVKEEDKGDKKEEDKDKDVTDEYVMVARDEATNEDVFHKEEVGH